MFEEFGRLLNNALNTVTGEAKGTPIETQVTPILIEYPTAEPVRLRIEIGVGKLRLAPGGEHLAEGSATYNIQEWAPETITEGGSVVLKQGQFWSVWPGERPSVNEWDLKLGTARPYELVVQKGVARAEELDFGGLPLTGLTFQAGAGESTLQFSRAATQPADRVTLRAGAGRLEARGLLNANAKVVSVEGGAGELRLDFDGEALQRDLHITVGMGVGELHLGFKAGLPVLANVSRGLGSVDARGDFRAADRGYVTPAYATASGPKILLDIRAGVGSVKLRTI